MDADAFESDAPPQIERMLLKPTDMDSAVVTRTTTKFRPQGVMVSLAFILTDFGMAL